MSWTDTAVRLISASPDRILAGLTDFDALAVWLPPDGWRSEASPCNEDLGHIGSRSASST
jgi:hypothetical protein